MRKLYLCFTIMTLLCSCGITRVDYIGNAYASTQQVDVFVVRDAIKKQYDVIGKGYVRMGPWSSYEKIQKKAVDKARKKGAEAIIIEDYYVMNANSNVISSSIGDSSAKSATAISNMQTHPSVASGFNIFFIKYRP